MKKLLSLLILLSMIPLVSGCHSDTVRGMGRDIEEVGEDMQK